MSESSVQRRARDLALNLSAEFLGALIVITEDGTIVSWNDGATSLYGYEPQEVVGKSILETIVPYDPSEAKRNWAATAAQGATATFESLRRRKDGLSLWAEVVVKIDVDPASQRLIILNERDITKIKYQREAQVMQTRFRGVLDAAPDAIVIVDTSGRVALVNSETERL